MKKFPDKEINKSISSIKYYLYPSQYDLIKKIHPEWLDDENKILLGHEYIIIRENP